MEQRKRHSAAMIPGVFMMALLILALPSWSLSQPPEKKQEPGILRTMYNEFMGIRGEGYVDPNFAHATADVIAGVPDHHDGDRASLGKIYILSDGSLGDEGDVCGDPKPKPPFKSFWEEMADNPTDPRVVKMRKRIAARRAKKALKEAQAAAQHEKKTAREQAAKALLSL